MKHGIVLEINPDDALALICSLEFTISAYGKIGEDYRAELIALKQKVCMQLEAHGIQDINSLVARAQNETMP